MQGVERREETARFKVKLHGQVTLRITFPSLVRIPGKCKLEKVFPANSPPSGCQSPKRASAGSRASYKVWRYFGLSQLGVFLLSLGRGQGHC